MYRLVVEPGLYQRAPTGTPPSLPSLPSSPEPTEGGVSPDALTAALQAAQDRQETDQRRETAQTTPRGNQREDLDAADALQGARQASDLAWADDVARVFQPATLPHPIASHVSAMGLHARAQGALWDQVGTLLGRVWQTQQESVADRRLNQTRLADAQSRWAVAEIQSARLRQELELTREDRAAAQYTCVMTRQAALQSLYSGDRAARLGDAAQRADSAVAVPVARAPTPPGGISRPRDRGAVHDVGTALVRGQPAELRRQLVAQGAHLQWLKQELREMDAKGDKERQLAESTLSEATGRLTQAQEENARLRQRLQDAQSDQDRQTVEIRYLQSLVISADKLVTRSRGTEPTESPSKQESTDDDSNDRPDDRKTRRRQRSDGCE